MLLLRTNFSVLDIVIIILLILLNAFFSLSEIALVSSKKVKLQHLKENKSKGASTALKLLDDSESFLSSIQVGITLIGTINGFYGGEKLAKYITPLFELMNCSHHTAYILASIIGIALITFFSIVWGELTPKTLALSKPEKCAVVVAPIVYLFSKMFYPIVKLLSFATRTTNKLIGVKESTEQITEEELISMIKTATREGVIEEEQNKIHENLFHFADKRGKHVMTHRSEVEWIDINWPYGKLVAAIQNCRNSKVLVCEGSLNDFIGVLGVQKFLQENACKAEADIRALIYEPIVFSEYAEATEILEEMRRHQSYFGVIVDEFGSMEGIITLHDLIENIVGRIPDQTEITDPDIVFRADNSALVSGDAPIETLREVIDDFEIDFEQIDYATVAGFVLDHLEQLPKVGEMFTWQDYTIEIVDMDHNRIDKILISRKPTNA